MEDPLLDRATVPALMCGWREKGIIVVNGWFSRQFPVAVNSWGQPVRPRLTDGQQREAAHLEILMGSLKPERVTAGNGHHGAPLRGTSRFMHGTLALHLVERIAFTVVFPEDASAETRSNAF
jgi:hypothetical protein